MSSHAVEQPLRILFLDDFSERSEEFLALVPHGHWVETAAEYTFANASSVSSTVTATPSSARLVTARSATSSAANSRCATFTPMPTT